VLVEQGNGRRVLVETLVKPQMTSPSSRASHLFHAAGMLQSKIT
jgi:hypothetical protein